jgi:hypothetical protein
MKEVGMNTWTYAAKRLPQRAIRFKRIALDAHVVGGLLETQPYTKLWLVA